MMKSLILTWALLVSSFVQAAPPTGIKGQDGTINYSVNAIVPYNQATKLAGNNVLIETGNANVLVNPDFEGAASTVPDGWTCTTGTCTKTTTSGEFSSGKAAMKVVPTGNSFDVWQSSSLVAGTVKQHVVGINYRIPATCSGAVLRIYADTVLQTTVPNSSLIIDDSFHTIEVPTVASSSIKINPYAVTTCTGNSFFDMSYVKQGISTQALQLDNVYSAQVSSAGVVSGENKDFISGNCAVTATSTYTCTFTAGYFTVTPNCWQGNAKPGTTVFGVVPSNTNNSQVQYNGYNPATAAATADPHILYCQKSGNDYLAASSAVYSQSNSSAQSSTIVQTATFGNVDITGALTTSVGSGCYTYASGTGIYTATNNCNIAISAMLKNSGAASVEAFIYKNATPMAADTTSAVAAQKASASANFNVVAGDTFKVNNNSTNNTSDQWITVVAVPSSNFIVGTFAGTPKVPGLDGNVDTFSVSYGTTSIGTSCSGSPCFIDQIGAAVSSITRSGAGVYSLNTARTYTKLRCTLSLINAGGNIGLYFNGMSCNGCSGFSFNTYTNTPTASDSTGVLFCQGAY